MNPGEVTRVIMRFDLPSVPFTVPSSPRTGGNEYGWHCHILELESTASSTDVGAAALLTKSSGQFGSGIAFTNNLSVGYMCNTATT